MKFKIIRNNIKAKTMKTIISVVLFYVAILSLMAFSFYKGETGQDAGAVINDTSANYLDGTYYGQSQSIYTSEPFWGHILISVNGGSFTDIQFTIRDSSTHEPVDSMYGVIHYPDNSYYMEQCVNDGHGIEEYPKRLMELQDLDKVDAITHATWSYNIFTASAQAALLNAEKPIGINSRNKSNQLVVHVLPNPVSAALIFEYNLDRTGYVNLSIYDNRGRLVEQLVSHEQQAGFHRIQWGDCPAAGIYFYRLQTDGVVVGSKIVRTGR
jgi:major membrane immunogen (membrane-anchored lipoprotein)